MLITGVVLAVISGTITTGDAANPTPVGGTTQSCCARSPAREAADEEFCNCIALIIPNTSKAHTPTPEAQTKAGFKSKSSPSRCHQLIDATGSGAWSREITFSENALKNPGGGCSCRFNDNNFRTCSKSSGFVFMVTSNSRTSKLVTAASHKKAGSGQFQYCNP